MIFKKACNKVGPKHMEMGKLNLGSHDLLSLSLTFCL